MSKLLTLIVLIGVTGASAPMAEAATTQDIERAQIIAKTVFPFDATPTWRIGLLSPENAAKGAIAEAQYRGCLDPDGICQIIYDPAYVDRASFPSICSVTIHERGHLAGFFESGGPDGGLHSADPHDVMYPESSSANEHPACGPSDAQIAAINERRTDLENYVGVLTDRLASMRDRLHKMRSYARHLRKAKRVKFRRRLKRYALAVRNTDQRLAKAKEELVKL